MISIITAAYNAEAELLETYRSITKQTITDWEWIVVDDNSADNTLNLLMQLCQEDSRVIVLNNDENRGAAASRNLAMEVSSGEYLAFLDADDTWHPEKLEKQIAFMEPNLGFSFTSYNLIDENGNKFGKPIDSKQTGPITYEHLLKKKVVLGCSTVILKKKSVGKIQMPLLKTGQDYATWLMILKAGTNAHLLNVPLTNYRIRRNSLSRNKLKKTAQTWKIFREIEQLDLLTATIYFIHYAIRSIGRIQISKK